MKTNKQVLFGVLIIIVSFLSLIMAIKSCNDKKEREQYTTNLINGLNDTIRYYKTKDSDQVATISILQSFSADDFIKYKIRDSEIVVLQKLVGFYKDKLKAGSSVTTATTTTVVNTKIKIDTIRYNTIDSIFPTYVATLNNEWINYKSVIDNTGDSLSLKVNNRYAVILGYDKKRPFVDVINYNPYSSTKILRSYQVSVPKQKMWGVGFSAGIGFSADLTPRPYFGVGVNYNIFKF